MSNVVKYRSLTGWWQYTINDLPTLQSTFPEYSVFHYIKSDNKPNNKIIYAKTIEGNHAITTGSHISHDIRYIIFTVYNYAEACWIWGAYSDTIQNRERLATLFTCAYKVPVPITFFNSNNKCSNDTIHTQIQLD